MIIINARFLTQNITGVQRFAIEISKKVKLILGNEVIFLSPKNIKNKELALALDVKTIGRMTGHLWEQIELPLYLSKLGNPMLLNLANTGPIMYSNKLVTVHDIAFERFPQTFNWKFRLFYKFLIPRLIKTSKHIFTVSEFSKKEIASFYKRNMDDITVIYNAVDDKFKPSFNAREEKYILAVSSLHYQKNFHSLIKVFNKLNKDIKLYLVGTINRNFATTDLLNDIYSNKNIIFKGRVNDKELIELYTNAECFIYPSLYEGFGIPPLEAQACGCPVACSNIASLPEVGNDSVLYFDPYNIDDIVDKINTLLDNEELRESLIQKGFNNKRFNWLLSAEKILNIVRTLK